MASHLYTLLVGTVRGGQDAPKLAAVFSSLRSTIEVEQRFSETRCHKVMQLAENAYQDNLPEHYTEGVHDEQVRCHGYSCNQSFYWLVVRLLVIVTCNRVFYWLIVMLFVVVTCNRVFYRTVVRFLVVVTCNELFYWLLFIGHQICSSRGVELPKEFSSFG